MKLMKIQKSKIHSLTWYDFIEYFFGVQLYIKILILNEELNFWYSDHPKITPGLHGNAFSVMDATCTLRRISCTPARQLQEHWPTLSEFTRLAKGILCVRAARWTAARGQLSWQLRFWGHTGARPCQPGAADSLGSSMESLSYRPPDPPTLEIGINWFSPKINEVVSSFGINFGFLDVFE